VKAGAVGELDDDAGRAEPAAAGPLAFGHLERLLDGLADEHELDLQERFFGLPRKSGIDFDVTGSISGSKLNDPGRHGRPLYFAYKALRVQDF
jgi:hypothetical protein